MPLLFPARMAVNAPGGKEAKIPDSREFVGVRPWEVSCAAAAGSCGLYTNVTRFRAMSGCGPTRRDNTLDNTVPRGAADITHEEETPESCR